MDLDLHSMTSNDFSLPVACECNPIGSASSMCDHMTGQCPCLPNVEGTRCDQCSLGHYGLSGGSGCTLCNCNPQGSVDSQCDLETGQCSCRPGVTGSLCDQCITGFFGLSENGCQGELKVLWIDITLHTYSGAWLQYCSDILSLYRVHTQQHNNRRIVYNDLIPSWPTHCHLSL